jgi:hypothetical protein
MDNKPVIETAVKDYNGKKINIIKLDIILTVVLLVISGILFYSLYPKIKNSHYMGNYKSDVDEEVDTTKAVSNEDKITIEELKSDKYIVYMVTNLTGSTKDITVRLNTYVGDTVDNTLSYQASAINNGSAFYAYFKKSDLKIYDKYDYIINSSNSIYTPATSIKTDIADYDQNNYTFTNYSGSVLNNLNVVILYYDSNDSIVEIEEKNKTLLEDKKSFEVNAKKDYEYFKVFVNEAYYIKKES